jgi:hypothetical protein
LARIEIAPETKKLSPLHQGQGKRAHKEQSPFATDAYMMIPTMNFLLEICLAARENNVFGFLCLMIFYYYAMIPRRRLVTATKTDSAQRLATSQSTRSLDNRGWFSDRQ